MMANVKTAPATEPTCCTMSGAARKLQTKAESALPLIKLMSEANRLNIFALLAAQGELCACDIESALGISQTLLSHHLRSLRDAGLLTARRDAQWIYYRVNKTELAKVYPLLCQIFNPECVK